MDRIDKLVEYDAHRMVVFVSDKKCGLEGFIAIHKGKNGRPSFGATRVWNYSHDQALRDALKLSKAMSYKALMAGLKCGGAKAVIIDKKFNNGERVNMLKAYADRVNLLGGNFITGADVGINRDDVIQMRRRSPYFVGVMADPVRFTALGLLYSIEVCVDEVFGGKGVGGRTFAVQGMGKIGEELIRLLYYDAKMIYGCDVDKERVKNIVRKYPKVKIVNPAEIYGIGADVFCPCAMGGSLNSKSIKQLKSTIIVGGANNQLESEEIADKLHKMGVLYAPDYVVNAGGLISVYDEYEYGNHRVRRVEKRVGRIPRLLSRLLINSRNTKGVPLYYANEYAKNSIGRI